MKCVFCGNDLTKSHQTIERRIKGKIVYVKNTPVDECKCCGEVYVDDGVVLEISSALESKQLFNESAGTTILDFEHLMAMFSDIRVGPYNGKLALH